MKARRGVARADRLSDAPFGEIGSSACGVGPACSDLWKSIAEDDDLLKSGRLERASAQSRCRDCTPPPARRGDPAPGHEASSTSEGFQAPALSLALQRLSMLSRRKPAPRLPKSNSPAPPCSRTTPPPRRRRTGRGFFSSPFVAPLSLTASAARALLA